MDICEINWQEAEKYLEELIWDYTMIGRAGTFALNLVLLPLKRRFDYGERTQELYEKIMACE